MPELLDLHDDVLVRIAWLSEYAHDPCVRFPSFRSPIDHLRPSPMPALNSAAPNASIALRATCRRLRQVIPLDEINLNINNIDAKLVPELASKSFKTGVRRLNVNWNDDDDESDTAAADSESQAAALRNKRKALDSFEQLKKAVVAYSSLRELSLEALHCFHGRWFDIKTDVAHKDVARVSSACPIPAAKLRKLEAFSIDLLCRPCGFALLALFIAAPTLTHVHTGWNLYVNAELFKKIAWMAELNSIGSVKKIRSLHLRLQDKHQLDELTLAVGKECPDLQDLTILSTNEDEPLHLGHHKVLGHFDEEYNEIRLSRSFHRTQFDDMSSMIASLAEFRDLRSFELVMCIFIADESTTVRKLIWGGKNVPSDDDIAAACKNGQGTQGGAPVNNDNHNDQTGDDSSDPLIRLILAVGSDVEREECLTEYFAVRAWLVSRVALATAKKLSAACPTLTSGKFYLKRLAGDGKDWDGWDYLEWHVVDGKPGEIQSMTRYLSLAKKWAQLNEKKEEIKFVNFDWLELACSPQPKPSTKMPALLARCSSADAGAKDGVENGVGNWSEG